MSTLTVAVPLTRPFESVGSGSTYLGIVAPSRGVWGTRTAFSASDPTGVGSSADWEPHPASTAAMQTAAARSATKSRSRDGRRVRAGLVGLGEAGSHSKRHSSIRVHLLLMATS